MRILRFYGVFYFLDKIFRFQKILHFEFFNCTNFSKILRNELKTLLHISNKFVHKKKFGVVWYIFMEILSGLDIRKVLIFGYFTSNFLSQFFEKLNQNPQNWQFLIVVIFVTIHADAQILWLILFFGKILDFWRFLILNLFTATIFLTFWGNKLILFRTYSMYLFIKKYSVVFNTEVCEKILVTQILENFEFFHFLHPIFFHNNFFENLIKIQWIFYY